MTIRELISVLIDAPEKDKEINVLYQHDSKHKQTPIEVTKAFVHDSSCILEVHPASKSVVIVRKDTLETTWEEIGKYAAEGRLDALLQSGDYIPLTLTNGDEVGLDIGRDDTGKFYFIFHNSMRDRHCMNPKWTNRDGWRGSDMRRYANEDVYNLLPDETKSVIKPTTVVQVLDGERIETSDNLFLLSATQVFGKDKYLEAQETEDTQIDIFRDPHARCKVLCPGTDKARTSWWWLRSVNFSDMFSSADTDGSSSCSNASNSGAVVLGFCIENE